LVVGDNMMDVYVVLIIFGIGFGAKNPEFAGFLLAGWVFSKIF